MKFEPQKEETMYWIAIGVIVVVAGVLFIIAVFAYPLWQASQYEEPD